MQVRLYIGKRLDVVSWIHKCYLKLINLANAVVQSNIQMQYNPNHSSNRCKCNKFPTLAATLYGLSIFT